MKIEELERKSIVIPPILKLDAAGLPCKWEFWQNIVTLSWNGKVKWTLGSPIKLFGGHDKSGSQSEFELFPIVAVDDHTNAKRRKEPLLTNRALFRRDAGICMYCGHEYPPHKLTRDHVIPVSKGGKNVWTNCVAACKHDNHRKADKTPEEAGMQLIAVPYTPSTAEHLILSNRRIQIDQMDYLKKMVPKSSPWWKRTGQVYV